jgi:hypothetical protein
MAKAASLADASSHNVPPEVFLKHYREIKQAKEDHADTGMAVARAKKSAKNAGIDLDAFKWLETLAKLDTDEAEMQIKHLQTYAGWLKLPIGTQLAMFGQPEPEPVDAKAAAEHSEWEARDQGSAEGKAGHERGDNPNLLGSPEYAAYDRGWLEGNEIWMRGQKKIASEMGPKANGNGAAPRKRGRPRSEAPEAML